MSIVHMAAVRRDVPHARLTDSGGIVLHLMTDRDMLTLDLLPALLSDDEIETYLDALSVTTRAALEAFQVRRHSLPRVGAS